MLLGFDNRSFMVLGQGPPILTTNEDLDEQKPCSSHPARHDHEAKQEGGHPRCGHAASWPACQVSTLGFPNGIGVPTIGCFAFGVLHVTAKSGLVSQTDCRDEPHACDVCFNFQSVSWSALLVLVPSMTMTAASWHGFDASDCTPAASFAINRNPLAPQHDW